MTRAAGEPPTTMPDLGANQEGPPGKRRCPTCGGRAPEDRWAAIESIVPSIASFRRRVVVDAINHQRVTWWLERAQDFENAKPKPDDFCGAADRDQLARRWRWCDETARACRAKAEFLRLCGDDLDDQLASLVADENGGGAK